VLYSGTVAAATEGFFHGFPAIAFSLAAYSGGFERSAQIAVDVIKRCHDNPLLKDNILSINIPYLSDSDSVTLSATRLGRRGRTGVGSIHSQDPRGEKIFWIGQVGDPQDDGTGTDFHAIKNGEVSVTPISVDMTAHDCVEPLGSILTGAAS